MKGARSAPADGSDFTRTNIPRQTCTAIVFRRVEAGLSRLPFRKHLRRLGRAGFCWGFQGPGARCPLLARLLSGWSVCAVQRLFLGHVSTGFKLPVGPAVGAVIQPSLFVDPDPNSCRGIHSLCLWQGYPLHGPRSLEKGRKDDKSQEEKATDQEKVLMGTVGHPCNAPPKTLLFQAKRFPKGRGFVPDSRLPTISLKSCSLARRMVSREPRLFPTGDPSYADLLPKREVRSH